MSFTAQTEHYWKEFPRNEQYTSFKLDLTEYSIFRQFYDQLRSTFVITNTDHKCHLQWMMQSVYSYVWKTSLKQAVVLVELAEAYKFDRMKIIVSIIDKNGTKIVSKSKMEENESSMIFPMTDADDHKADLTIEKYLHNGTLTILCELMETQLTRVKSIPIDSTQIHAENFHNNVQKKFEEFFKNGDLCDVIIFVEDAEFHVHKIVLVANSPVFDAMFTTRMKEQIENTVTITDIDVATFEALLRYMYTGTVERNDDQVRDLLVVADKYDVVNLINLCKAYIANELKTRTEHYWRQCPNKNQYTSFTWNLTEFITMREFELITPAQFVITNTDYECELQVSDYESDTMNVHVRFPKDCKLVLKVNVSLIDRWGQKMESKSWMKREQTDSLTFTMVNFGQAINSPSGNLTILCELIYVDLTPIKSLVEGQLEDRNFTNSIKKKIELFFNDKYFCDVTVVVEDVKIHAHKVVLAANSPVFKAMFSENTAEHLRNTVTVDDSNATTVEAFLTFMYTGSFEKSEQLIKDLLIPAKKYQVIDLITLCENYTERYLNADNVKALIASETFG